MIAISALLVAALLFFAWRRGAWGVALLGIAVGISANGPVTDGINAGVTATTALVNSLGDLV